MFVRVFALAAILISAVSYAGDDFKSRLWPTAEQTRLVIETPAKVEYRILSLQNPERLVLDITDGKNDVSGLNGSDLRDAGYLHALRAARRNSETLRLVFDIRESVRYEVRALQPVGDYAHRLIMDISPQNAPDPLLALIESFGGVAPAEDFLVVIDPGHGGEDPGAVSRNNIYEKNIVLSICHKLQKEINSRPGMRAALTRTDDRFLPLAQRVITAHRLGADAFISLHADSVVSPKARGSSVFILSQRGASSKFAKRLAHHANLADIVGGSATDPQLSAALPAFFQDGKDRASRRLGELILAEAGKINRLHKKHVESAGFAVLKSLSIPSVLVETAFISNPEEEKKLRDEGFQLRMAKAIANGVQQYHERYEVSE